MNEKIGSVGIIRRSRPSTDLVVRIAPIYFTFLAHVLIFGGFVHGQIHPATRLVKSPTSSGFLLAGNSNNINNGFPANAVLVGSSRPTRPLQQQQQQRPRIQGHHHQQKPQQTPWQRLTQTMAPGSTNGWGFGMGIFHAMLTSNGYNPSKNMNKLMSSGGDDKNKDNKGQQSPGAKPGPSGASSTASPSSGSSGDGTVVMTAEGAVMGRKEDNKVNKPFVAFRGIPYAKAPVGELRFRSPQRHPPWQGVKMTMEYQQSCLAYVARMLMGEEDCLFLNVFVPQGARATNEEGRPVVVWIHGGAFLHGSELLPIFYQPGTFTDRGAVFVTLNYRLGALGFLSMDDEVIPGNYGMKDMVMALKWVRRNIRRFGGDPNKVTIIGQSAGGVAVHALSLSPMAKGLFNSAISMSGSIFTLWGHQPTGKPTARRLAEIMGCPSDNSGTMLSCLRLRGAKELVLALQEFFFLGSRYGTPFAPVVDTWAEDPFMPEHPLKIITGRKFQQVPYIFGSMPRDMNLFLPGVMYDPVSYDKLTNDWDNECGRVAYNFLYFDQINPSPAETRTLCKRARGIYMPKDGPIDPDGDGEHIGQFGSDIYFAAATYSAALLHARFSEAPVYYYSWEHENEGALKVLDVINGIADNGLQLLYMNSTRIRPNRLIAGASHSDDANLLFDPPGFQKLSPSDAKTKNFVVAMFNSFWSGKRPNVKEVEWPRFEPATQKHVTVTANPQIRSFLITPERLELFANWYDVVERKFVSRRGADRLSLSRLLGFRTPTASIGGGTNVNEIFRDSRSITQGNNKNPDVIVSRILTPPPLQQLQQQQQLQQPQTLDQQRRAAAQQQLAPLARLIAQRRAGQPAPGIGGLQLPPIPPPSNQLQRIQPMGDLGVAVLVGSSSNTGSFGINSRRLS